MLRRAAAAIATVLICEGHPLPHHPRLIIGHVRLPSLNRARLVQNATGAPFRSMISSRSVAHPIVDRSFRILVLFQSVTHTSMIKAVSRCFAWFVVVDRAEWFTIG